MALHLIRAFAQGSSMDAAGAGERKRAKARGRERVGEKIVPRIGASNLALDTPTSAPSPYGDLVCRAGKVYVRQTEGPRPSGPA